jgi:glycerol-3-phosphate acyltransferase PlsY
MDALKGAAATIVPALLPRALPGTSPIDPRLAALAAGAVAILGHVFTPWLGFKGGRGVATSLGVFLGVLPVPTLVAFAFWIVLVWVSRRVSVGSVGAAVAYPLLVAWFYHGDPQRRWILLVSTLMALLILVRHAPNIRRLLKGTEPPIVGAAKEGRP